MAGLTPLVANTNLLAVVPQANESAASGASFATHFNQATEAGQPAGQAPVPVLAKSAKTNVSANTPISAQGQLQPVVAQPVQSSSPLPPPASVVGSTNTQAPVTTNVDFPTQTGNSPSISTETMPGPGNFAAPVIPLLNLQAIGYSPMGAGASPASVGQSFNTTLDALNAPQNGTITSTPGTEYGLGQANYNQDQSGTTGPGIGLATAAHTVLNGLSKDSTLAGAAPGSGGIGQQVTVESNNGTSSGNAIPAGAIGNTPAPTGNANTTQSAVQVAQILNSLQAEKAQFTPLPDLSALNHGQSSDNTTASANPFLQTVHSAFDFSANAIKQAARSEFSGQNMNGGNNQNSGAPGDSHSSPASGQLTGMQGSTNQLFDPRFTLDTSARHDAGSVASNQPAGINNLLTLMPPSAVQSSSAVNLPTTTASNSLSASASNLAALEKAMAAEAPAAPTATGMVNSAAIVENGGRIEMHVDLRMDALGAIQLHAVLQDGRLGASIGVDNREAHTLLNSELPALHQNLIEKNVQIEHLSVVDSGASGRNNSQMMAGSNSGNSNQHSHETLVWRNAGSVNIPEAGRALSTETSSVVDPGRLSVLA